MKVICIYGKRINPLTTYDLPEGIPLGAVDDGGCCYTIIGYEKDPVHGRHTVWNKKRFIPLSDIDETELIKEREQYLITK